MTMPDIPPGIEDAASGRMRVGDTGVTEPDPDTPAEGVADLLGLAREFEDEASRLQDEFGGVSASLDAAIEEKLDAISEAAEALRDSKPPDKWLPLDGSDGRVRSGLLPLPPASKEDRDAEEQFRNDYGNAHGSLTEASSIDNAIIAHLVEYGWLECIGTPPPDGWWWVIPKWKKTPKAKAAMEDPEPTWVDPFPPDWYEERYLSEEMRYRGAGGALRWPKMPNDPPGLPPPDTIQAVGDDTIPPASTPEGGDDPENLQIGIGGGAAERVGIPSWWPFKRGTRRAPRLPDIPPHQIPEGTVPPFEEDPDAPDDLPPDLPDEDRRWLEEIEREAEEALTPRSEDERVWMEAEMRRIRAQYPDMDEEFWLFCLHLRLDVRRIHGGSR